MHAYLQILLSLSIECHPIHSLPTITYFVSKKMYISSSNNLLYTFTSIVLLSPEVGPSGKFGVPDGPRFDTIATAAILQQTRVTSSNQPHEMDLQTTKPSSCLRIYTDACYSFWIQYLVSLLTATRTVFCCCCYCYIFLPIF